MRAWLVSVALLSGAALAKSDAECEHLRVRPGSVPGPGAPDHSATRKYRFVEDCGRNQNWKKVDADPRMRRLLSGLAGTVNQTLEVYSCFRPQQQQDWILCRNDCAPRFGAVQCSGRIAANQSEHTVGVAADIRIRSTLPPGSPDAALIEETKRFCRVLDRNRKRFNGGWGGMTVYGVDPKTSIAFGHMDLKKDWCNWGRRCEEALGMGHCKRAMFKAKVAVYEQQIADAKLRQARAELARLEKELRELQADCPPGDQKCRDNFIIPEP